MICDIDRIFIDNFLLEFIILLYYNLLSFYTPRRHRPHHTNTTMLLRCHCVATYIPPTIVTLPV
jgi:hypothetical protein